MNERPEGDSVDLALRRLKEGDEALSASPSVEGRLRAEVRARNRESQPWNRGVMLALAASVVMCIAVPAMWLRSASNAATDGPVPGVAGGPPTSVVGGLQPAEAVTEFYPLFYASLPATSAHIVRMEVPRSSLVRLGLSSADGLNASGTVLADVMVGEDDLARAVRFVTSVSQE